MRSVNNLVQVVAQGRWERRDSEEEEEEDTKAERRTGLFLANL